jgi:23S rRNA pseudouridine1911/1915/1917 synthase
MKTSIVYEDHEILVCHKPAGFPVQTRRAGAQDMESELKNYLYRKSGKKEMPYIGIIHRLDQPVEGLLIFAKNSTAAAALNRQMQTDNFGKYYIAEVCGIPADNEGTLTDYLIKNPAVSRAEVVDRDRKDAKKAVLHYKVLERREETSLLQIHLETGRFHQIRAQMAHMGCPIVGDTKYNPAYKDVRGYQRTHLCAYRLELRHPKTGKKLEFEIHPEWEMI